MSNKAKNSKESILCDAKELMKLYDRVTWHLPKAQRAQHGDGLPVSTAKMALAQIQIYADRCYGVTETHKANINALESVEAVNNYDYTTGYPEKLTFELK